MKNRAGFRRSLICLLVLAVLLAFCVPAMTSELLADHDCTGDTCVICLCGALRTYLGRWLVAVALIAAAVVLPGSALYFCCNDSWCRRVRQTPVHLKVKLSD